MVNVYDIKRDITYINEIDVLNLCFIAHFVDKRKLNYETQKLCFAIGINCNETEIHEEYTNGIIDYAKTYEIKSFFIENEETKKKEFLLPESFNIPRNVLNSQLEKDEMRYYFIMALISKRKGMLSNLEMQSLWEDSNSELHKAGELAFKQYVLLGAKYFVKVFFDEENKDIVNTFIALNNLENESEIENSFVDNPITSAERNFEKEIYDIDVTIENMRDKIANYETQKTRIEMEKLNAIHKL